MVPFLTKGAWDMKKSNKEKLEANKRSHDIKNMLLLGGMFFVIFMVFYTA